MIMQHYIKKGLKKLKSIILNGWDAFGSMLACILIFTGFGILWLAIEGVFPGLQEYPDHDNLNDIDEE